MKYMGSKSRIAKYIVPILQDIIDKNGIENYVEPFCGGCNVIDKIRCKERAAYDNNKYLIALWEHLTEGGLPGHNALPSTVIREHYNLARDYYRFHGLPPFSNGYNLRLDEWELGAIGFLASYNGRFFDGGYAQPGYDKGHYRNYYEEAKNNIMTQVPLLKGVHFDCSDYKEVIERCSRNFKNILFYCDPPYQGKKQYGIKSLRWNKNDYDTFWNVMRQYSKDNYIVISEENAPEDFECIWEQDVLRSIKATDKSRSTEKLFKLKGAF